ncbi:MAG: hypothetical protein OQL20_00520 [Sedimenticola sp.]|nr:hypothetical protein [Sedimenticola sp.]
MALRSKGKHLLSAISLAIITTASFPILSFAADSETEEKYKEAIYLRETGDTGASIELLNGILSANPQLHRARLELGVAHARQQNYEEAKQQAKVVLDDPKLPPTVRVSVLAFIAQMEAEQKKYMDNLHVLEPSISIGMMYDSNVNTGPDVSTIDISGGTLTLTSGANALEDWAKVINAGLYHRYQGFAPLNFNGQKVRAAWETKANLYSRSYSDYSEYNLDVMSLRTGPAFAAEGDWRANVGAQVDFLRLGSDKLGVFTSLLPSVTWQVKDGELTVDATLQDRNYTRAVDVGRDSDYWSLGVSYGRLFSEGKFAFAGGLKTFGSDADNARFSNDGWEAFVGGSVVAWPNGSVFARASYRDSEYDGVEPVFNVARNESQKSLLIGFSHEIKGNKMDGWKIEGTYNRTDNSSNVAIYDYDRDIYSISLNKSF